MELTVKTRFNAVVFVAGSILLGLLWTAGVVCGGSGSAAGEFSLTEDRLIAKARSLTEARVGDDYQTPFALFNQRLKTEDQETVADVVKASAWLKKQPGIDPEIFFTGPHLERIRSGPCRPAGGWRGRLYNMAATPRRLWESSYDRNMFLIEEAQTEGRDP